MRVHAPRCLPWLTASLLLVLTAECEHQRAQPPVRGPSTRAALAGAADGLSTPAVPPLTRPAPALPRPGHPRATLTSAPAPGAWPFPDARPEDPAAARRRPASIRDLYRIKGVHSPDLSPDGKRVVFVGTSMDLDKGKTQYDLYVVGVDGKGLRQLTRSKAADYSPHWSPDGRYILFVSTRKKGAQLWRMPLAGGDPEQLTKLSTGVSHPRWAPDGQAVAFTSRVYPEHPLDDAKNKARMDELEKGPIHAHLTNELFFRHWTQYDDGRRQHILRLDLKTKTLSDLTPGPFDSPPISLNQGTEYAFSPDGQELCFASNRTPGSKRASSTNNDIYVVRVPGVAAGAATALTHPAVGKTPAAPGPAPTGATDKPRLVTGVNKAWDGSCTYSPDGRYLAFRMQFQPGYESDRLRLAVLERATGKVRVLTPKFDHWVTDYSWFPDSRRLLFQAPAGGRWPLFTVDLKSGAIRQLPAPPSVRQFTLSADGRTIVFTHSTVAQPTELFVVSADGTTPRKLTEQNKALSDAVDFRPAESMWVTAEGGRRIHVFIVKPHGFRPGRTYPLILNVHGGPQYQWSDSFRDDWQVYPAKGYVVAFPNTTGSVGYGQKLTADISKDWGGRVYRDTMKVTDALAKLPYVDANRMGVMGWSYGGYLVNWIIGQTHRFKVAASMMGVYDLRMWFATTEEQWFPEWDIGGQPWTRKVWRKFSPSNYATRIKTPTLILTGERDFRIPYTQSIALFTDLRKQGVPARLIIFPNDGHWPNRVKSMPVYYNAHLEWFARYLGGGAAPWKTSDMVENRAYAKDKPTK